MSNVPCAAALRAPELNAPPLVNPYARDDVRERDIAALHLRGRPSADLPVGLQRFVQHVSYPLPRPLRRLVLLGRPLRDVLLVLRFSLSQQAASDCSLE